MTWVEVFDVLRWGQRARSVFVPAKLDDREGVEDCACETARPALGAGLSWAKRIAGAWAIPLWMTDCPDRLQNIY